MNDRELIEKLRAGDIGMYKEVFDSRYKKLVVYANRFLNDVESSRDIVQEVFCYVWEKRNALSIEYSLDSYLYRAVHNTCINHIKRSKLKANYIQDFLLRVNEEPVFEGENANGYDYLVGKDLSDRIDQILDSLPTQCNIIFKLSRYRGLKNKEIADLYNISVRTVETQIFRALKVFKEKLQHTPLILILLGIL